MTNKVKDQWLGRIKALNSEATSYVILTNLFKYCKLTFLFQAIKRLCKIVDDFRSFYHVALESVRAQKVFIELMWNTKSGVGTNTVLTIPIYIWLFFFFTLHLENHWSYVQSSTKH